MIIGLSNVFGAIIRRPWLVVAGVVVATALFAVGASNMRLDGDLARLLPDSARSVQGLERLESIYGDQIGRITIILRSEPDQDLRPIADELAAQLAELDGVDRTEARRPRALLDEFRLLYLKLDDLREVRKRIEKRIRWEKKRANPLFVDLGGGEAPEVDVSDIEARYGDGPDYYRDASGEVLLFVRPSFSATNLDQTDKLVRAVQSTTDAFLANNAPNVSASYTGRYVKRVEQQSLMIADIGKATTVALVLLALLLLLYFRSFVTTIQVVSPLIVGTLAAMAGASLLFGSLNILTGFLGAILLGLGVDYGIHLVSRLQEERQSRELAAALVETFRTTGKANLWAGLTTAAALGSLTVSSFRAFFEFGVIALGGILCILLSYAIVLPVLAVITERLTTGEGGARASLSSLVAERFGPLLTGEGSAPRRRGVRIVAATLLAGAVVVALVGIGRVDFDSSFENLTITNTDSWRLDQRVNEILGQSQTPAVILVENDDHEDRVLQALADRSASDPAAVQMVLTRGDLLPTQQDEKLEILRDLREDLVDVPRRARSDELEDLLAEVDGLLDRGPIELDSLPPALRQPFSRTDGEGSVVLVLPGLDLNDLSNSRRFVDQISGLPGNEGGMIDGLSDAMLLTEIFDFVQEDIIWMLALTLAGLLLVVLLAFGPRRDVLILLGTLTLALATALGVMGLVGVDFNFINVLILPVWLGLGVDASFHLLMHVRQHPDRPRSHVATLGSVSAAFLTSMTGFGAMMVSHHNGLWSLAWVALLGLGAILVVNVAVGLLLSTNAVEKTEQA